jgi:hypothetical protein
MRPEFPKDYCLPIVPDWFFATSLSPFSIRRASPKHLITLNRVSSEETLRTGCA